VESHPAEKVAEHRRFTAAGGTVVVDHCKSGCAHTRWAGQDA
jgi:hypothetical protein